MKNLLAMTVAALSPLFPGAAFAQSGSMMNGANTGGGWMGGYAGMGGYGGAWVPTLLVIAVVALVVWAITQKRK